MRSDTVLISIRFGTQFWEHIPFPAALNAIERFLNDEEKEFIVLKTQTNTDQWFASYFSELLGRAKPPAECDWSVARITLGRARNAYEAGRDQEATQGIEESIRAFNAVHHKFWTYREALSKGGERSINTIHITEFILVTALGAGYAIAGAESGAIATAGQAAAQTAMRKILFDAAQETGQEVIRQIASNAAKVHFGLQKQFDVADMVLKTCTAFVASLVGGALSEKFLHMVVQRCIARGVLKQFNPLAKEFMPRTKKLTEFFIETGFDKGIDKLTDIVIDLAKENRGRMMKMGEFMEKIADRIAMPMPPSPSCTVRAAPNFPM